VDAFFLRTADNRAKAFGVALEIADLYRYGGDANLD
jgi:hypothetical protein